MSTWRFLPASLVGYGWILKGLHDTLLICKLTVVGCVSDSFYLNSICSRPAINECQIISTRWSYLYYWTTNTFQNHITNNRHNLYAFLQKYTDGYNCAEATGIWDVKMSCWYRKTCKNDIIKATILLIWSTYGSYMNMRQFYEIFSAMLHNTSIFTEEQCCWLSIMINHRRI